MGSNFLTFSAIGFGYGLDLGIGTGGFCVLGFGIGFSTGGTYFVGINGSGNNLTTFDFNGFNLFRL